MSILDQEKSMESSSSNGFWNSSPKTMFYMGLFVGLAGAAIVALAVVLTMVWNGKLGGIAGTPAAVAQVPTGTQPTDPTQQPPAQPVQPYDEKKDHLLGNKSAKVTLIEYSDFQCPFCQRHLPTVQQALKNFPKDVRLVFRHYPLSFHEKAEKAAEASECAAKLGGNDAFWKLHDKLFEKSPEIGVDVLPGLAKSIGLDEAAFKRCLDSGEMKSVVDAHAASGDAAGVRGTPATFVNGVQISGAVPYADFEKALKDAGAKE